MHASPVPLVAAHAVDLRCGSRPALCGVDLVVGPGEVHGLLGPHGAGKTLLLRALDGAMAPASGSVRVAGTSVLVAGEQSAIALARALASEPEVLLIDEPPNGFDSETTAAARALVIRHATRGGAVVWATRRLDSLHGIASGVTLLAAGHTRYSGSVEALVLRSLAGSAEDWSERLGRAA